jgi:hypothetical protein
MPCPPQVPQAAREQEGQAQAQAQGPAQALLRDFQLQPALLRAVAPQAQPSTCKTKHELKQKGHPSSARGVANISQASLASENISKSTSSTSSSISCKAVCLDQTRKEQAKLSLAIVIRAKGVDRIRRIWRSLAFARLLSFQARA